MQYRSEHNKEKIYLILLYMFYSLIGTIGKYNAMTSKAASIRFFMLLGLQLLGLLVFTIVWQQILKRLELSVAYLFKGTTILWSMVFAGIIFKESITLNNIVGGLIIIIGIGVVIGE